MNQNVAKRNSTVITNVPPCAKPMNSNNPVIVASKPPSPAGKIGIIATVYDKNVAADMCRIFISGISWNANKYSFRG